MKRFYAAKISSSVLVYGNEALTLYFKVGCGVIAAMRVINYTAVVIGIGHGDVEDGEVGLPLPCGSVLEHEAILGGIGSIDWTGALVP